MQRTIPQMFEDSVKKFPNNNYLFENTTGEYIGTTYTQTKELVYQFAAGLLSLGIKKGDRIALISEGRNAWVISELGILYTGAINVPLSAKLNEPSELKFRMEHSGCRMIIASRFHVDKIKAIKDELPKLEKMIVLDPQDSYANDELLYDDILESGKKYLEENQDELDKIWQSLSENDYANICYTSGTTADPKGIILSHRNYTANVEQALSLMPVPETYTTLLAISWDHSFAHSVGIYALMKAGASLASVQQGKTPMEALKNFPKNIKQVRPSFLLSVPALAKNFKKNIEKAIKDKGKTAERLFNWGLKVSYAYNKDGWNKGKGLSFMLKPLVSLFDKILFSKVRDGFGNRLEFFIGGAALLDIDLQHFFYAIGIPMFQGYGLSEASPVISSNAMHKHKLGSSGFLVDNLELKICDEDGKALPAGQNGEIVVKGDNIMVGYWENEKATSEALKDGWLYTGDLGYMDKDGFLYVMGRFKSLLISNDGEKYSPEGIEEALVEHTKYIEQVMLYNNQNAYTVALVVPNISALKSYLKHHKLELNSEEGKKTALECIQKDVNEFKTGGRFEEMFPQRWLPASIAVLEEAFTEENRMINSTLKMVRGKVTKHYQERIAFLYTAEAKNIVNSVNFKAINNWK